ncbi:MAG TPA: ChaN family lipoprotein [Abditibacterium sp.]|jgi:uncharacterized iron-regulated protein
MHRLLISTVITVFLWLLASPALGQTAPDSEQFRLFDSRGMPATLFQLVEQCGKADVVFWGEEHDDAVGHALQAQFFGQLIATYKNSRQIALSMEMFERDTQVVLDEYLADLITEKQFLESSRPWSNYSQDLKPLILLAKQHQLSVIASNAPRRYVNLVARRGPQALEALSPTAKTWLAPLPYPPASARYASKISALMGTGMAMHSKYMIESQALWDATMADSLSRFLKAQRNPLILHLSGRFHSEQKLGTVEQLLHLQPLAKICVVTTISTPSFSAFDAKMHSGLGDFVILTAPNPKGKAKP